MFGNINLRTQSTMQYKQIQQFVHPKRPHFVIRN